MRLALNTAALVAASFILAGAAGAGPKARKLTADAYVKTAKIEIAATDTTKYAYAQVMLDSLLMNYGPYAEGYFWIAKMKIDMNEKNGDLKKKLPYLKTAVAYVDSLHLVCADKSAKPNNRKGCDKFIQELDSIKVYYWRTYYNAGVEQLKQISSQMDVLKIEKDSSTIEVARNIVEQCTDSCIDNMTLAIAIDPADSRAYIGIANAYEKQDSVDRSTEWLTMGLARAKTPEEKLPLVQQLAVSTGSAGKYCDAARYFSEWVTLIPKDTGAIETMSNLAICLNGCKDYDSAVKVQREILALRPNDMNALIGVGKYFNEIASWAGDSSRAHETAKDSTSAKRWLKVRTERYDSSKTYFKRVFDLYPDSSGVADQYGLICAAVGDYNSAATAFEQVTKVDASNAGAWTSLGDCYLYLKRWKDAMPAYEKSLSLEPSNKAVMEVLKNLYHDQNLPAKEAELEARLKKL